MHTLSYDPVSLEKETHGDSTSDSSYIAIREKNKNKNKNAGLLVYTPVSNRQMGGLHTITNDMYKLILSLDYYGPVAKDCTILSSTTRQQSDSWGQ